MNVSIPCDNWKTLFGLTQCHIAAFFETSVLKEVRILYPLSPR